MLKVLASHIGLESTGYGRAFRSKDEIFRIVSINPNRSKCPINAERVADGRGFEFPTDNVAIRLSSVHAIRMYILCSFKSPNMQLRAPYPRWVSIVSWTGNRRWAITPSSVCPSPFPICRQSINRVCHPAPAIHQATMSSNASSGSGRVGTSMCSVITRSRWTRGYSGRSGGGT